MSLVVIKLIGLMLFFVLLLYVLLYAFCYTMFATEVFDIFSSSYIYICYKLIIRNIVIIIDSRYSFINVTVNVLNHIFSWLQQYLRCLVYSFIMILRP